MVAFSVPPGYRRDQPVKRPKLDAWVGVIDAILDDDKQRPAKQRHTAKRVWERLREEHQFTGGYTIVKDYLRSAAQRGREMFVPLVHPAGEAQADFGEAVAVIGGVECKAHYLAMDLPHSDDCFVIAFPAETTEAFLEGHVRAFAYFCGVPTRILYDNTKIAVAKILGGTERQRTRAFSELQSHYLFADKFGRPAKGNDKGKVEGLVGYARRNFMVPVPCFATWEAFNAHLERQCRKRRERTLRGHTETIAERFERDRAAFPTLPAAPYEACDYSVPTRHGHLQVLVRGYVHEVTIACGGELIARHPRSYEREAVVYDPLHYLALLEQKTRALDQAAPLQGWQLPASFATLRRLLEARLKHGGREYVQVLRLLETFKLDELTQAIEDALELGTIGFDAVKHLLLCRIERRPPRLDMENYPHLPLAQVRTTLAADYMSLLAMPSETGATA
jgi:transposase